MKSKILVFVFGFLLAANLTQAGNIYNPIYDLGTAITSITGLLYGNGSTVTGITNGAAGTVLIGGTPPTMSASPTGLTLVSSTKFTTTGTGTFPGVTVAGADYIGVASGGSIQFNNGSPASLVNIGNNLGSSNQTYTSGGGAETLVQSGYAPASGSGSWAELHLNPTINGTSSGTAYGLGIASKTNTLTGGTVKLFSCGTTTTDLFTGYTELCVFDISGNLRTAGYLQSGSVTALTLTAGAIGMTKIAASGSAPGAAGLKLEVVCGTNAGTAKIIAIAGTSTTAVTIVDNVGAAVTGC